MWRVLLILIVVLLVVACGCGYVWWTRPSLRSVPLPEGVEAGVDEYVFTGAIPPLKNEEGRLGPGKMYSRDHEWVGVLVWAHDYTGEKEWYELRLGESVHIEGLGVVTLLAVNPGPLISLPTDEVGGTWVYRVNIVYDPGVVPLYLGGTPPASVSPSPEVSSVSTEQGS